jgi:hypothetical protein
MRCKLSNSWRCFAANAEVRAGRQHALRRGVDDVGQDRFVRVPAPLGDAKAHALAGQRTGDEYGLALQTRDAAAIVGQIHNVGLLKLAEA